MTAIDPQRLAREISALDRDLDNPRALRSRLIALLDIYADRTRRTGARANPERAPWSFDVPAPILRALKQHLAEKLAGKPELAWGVIEELWDAGYRETQMLAADVLALQEAEQAAAWAEEHVAGSVDRGTLTALGASGLTGWRRADPQGFLTRISRWVHGEEARLKALAFSALGAAVREPSFHDLPSIYNLMRTFLQPVRGDARRAMFELVQALALRSPAETAYFLLDRMKRGGPGAERLARHVLNDLPPPQQAAIRKALSGGMPAGRI